MLDDLDEGSVGLSREQSSSSEGLLFSDSDEVAESEDKGMTTKKVCGEEEDVVPCSQPDSDVEICPNDISPQEDRVDVTKELNRSGRPVRAASLGVGQYLVAARAAAASRACVEAGPRGARTDRQRRALSQTAMRRAMTDVQPYDRNEAVPQSATQPAPLTSASLLLRKYVADLEKLPVRFLQCKDRNMSSLDRAVARVLTGEITIEQVNRHHVSKSSVKKRMTRLKNGLATPGRKPTLPRSVEEAIVTYVDDHTNAGMARYRDEVWDKAEQLAREAKVKKRKREEERAATQRSKEEERVATQRRKEEERAARPKRGVKRKAGPEQWDDGTTCPCGNDVGTGLTENWVSVTPAKRGFTTAALAWNGHGTAHTLSSLTAGGNVPGAGPRPMMETMVTTLTLTIPSPPWLGVIAHKES